MAKNLKKKQVKIKVKKKIWFKVLAPAIFGMKEIGESYLTTAEDAVGRVMKVNLRNLTGSMRDQNVYITLKISGIKGTALQTRAVGYELVPIFLKRIVRKRSSRIDEVLSFKSKDGQELKLKALILTFNRNNRSVGTSIRKALQEMLNEEIAKENFETFLSNLVNLKVQHSLKKKLNKIYPLKDVLIRDMRLTDLTDKDVVVDETEKVAEAPETAEAPVKEAKEAPVEAEVKEVATEEPAKEVKEEATPEPKAEPVEESKEAEPKVTEEAPEAKPEPEAETTEEQPAEEAPAETEKATPKEE